jgi:hypothetical protein
MRQCERLAKRVDESNQWEESHSVWMTRDWSETIRLAILAIPVTDAHVNLRTGRVLSSQPRSPQNLIKRIRGLPGLGFGERDSAQEGYGSRPQLIILASNFFMVVTSRAEKGPWCPRGE